MILTNQSINNSNITEQRYPQSTNGHNIFNEIIAYFLILLSMVGISGNSFIIYKFGYEKRKRRSVYETLLLALSIADLACVSISPLVFAYGSITNFQSWKLGVIGCKLVLPILPMNVSITQGMLILISYERYHAVHRPFSISSTRRRRIYMGIIVCLITAIILASPYTYALDIVNVPKHSTQTCTTDKTMNDVLLAFSSINVSRDIITAVVLTTTSYLTTKLLYRNTRSVALENNAMRFKDARRVSLLRVRRMLLTMSVVFCICTFPLDFFQFGLYISFRILKDNFSASAYLVVRTVNTVLHVLQISNSVANIFVYARTHKDFRNVSRRLCPANALWSKKQSRDIQSCYSLEKRAVQIEMISFTKINKSTNNVE
eukprot:gene7015-7800_t